MTHDLLPALIDESETAVSEYGRALWAYRGVQERLTASRRFFGNDNNTIVGIARFWAIRFYVERGYAIHELPARPLRPVFDFVVSCPTKDLKQVQVRSIVGETRPAGAVQLNGQWDELCIVQLDEKLAPQRIAVIGRAAFNDRIKSNSRRRTIHRRWLDEGWMEVEKVVIYEPPSP